MAVTRKKKRTLTWLLRQLLKHKIFDKAWEGFKGDWKEKQGITLCTS